MKNKIIAGFGALAATATLLSASPAQAADPNQDFRICISAESPNGSSMLVYRASDLRPFRSGDRIVGRMYKGDPCVTVSPADEVRIDPRSYGMDYRYNGQSGYPASQSNYYGGSFNPANDRLSVLVRLQY